MTIRDAKVSRSASNLPVKISSQVEFLTPKDQISDNEKK